MDLFVNQSLKKNKSKSLFFVDDSTSFLFVFLDQGCCRLSWILGWNIKYQSTSRKGCTNL